MNTKSLLDDNSPNLGMFNAEAAITTWLSKQKCFMHELFKRRYKGILQKAKR